MIDFGSRYDYGIFVGVGFYGQWSFVAAPIIVGNIASYRTLTGMGA